MHPKRSDIIPALLRPPFGTLPSKRESHSRLLAHADNDRARRLRVSIDSEEGNRRRQVCLSKRLPNEAEDAEHAEDGWFVQVAIHHIASHRISRGSITGAGEGRVCSARQAAPNELLDMM